MFTLQMKSNKLKCLVCFVHSIQISIKIAYADFMLRQHAVRNTWNKEFYISLSTTLLRVPNKTKLCEYGEYGSFECILDLLWLERIMADESNANKQNKNGACEHQGSRIHRVNKIWKFQIIWIKKESAFYQIRQWNNKLHEMNCILPGHLPMEMENAHCWPKMTVTCDWYIHNILL